MPKFNSIKETLEDIAHGRMVVVVDDEDRENEGDLVMAAQFVTPEAINFMIHHGKGLVCLPATDDIIDRWGLEEMVAENKEKFNTAFTISIDAAPHKRISTGISPFDRAITIQTFIGKDSNKEDLVSPGHVFPLRAKEMGVLRRAGHTEAAVDLARLANLIPAGVICEIIKDNGEMARSFDLIKFAQKHGLKIVTIENLIQYRIQNERFIEKIETIKLPTQYGNFDLTLYRDIINKVEHLALTKGDITGSNSTLARVHSECLTGDVFQSERCDCGEQLSSALNMISEAGCGVLLYMRQEGRGIGLANKLKAYKLQEKGMDTVEANKQLGFPPDLRDYGVGAQILLDLGIKNLDLITNNNRKVVGLEGYGLNINKRVPLVVKPNEHNEFYLKTKSLKLGHFL